MTGKELRRIDGVKYPTGKCHETNEAIKDRHKHEDIRHEETMKFFTSLVEQRIKSLGDSGVAALALILEDIGEADMLAGDRHHNRVRGEHFYTLARKIRTLFYTTVAPKYKDKYKEFEHMKNWEYNIGKWHFMRHKNPFKYGNKWFYLHYCDHYSSSKWIFYCFYLKIRCAK